MIDDFVILDDFIPKQYEDLIEKEMLSENVNWHYMQDVTYDAQALDEFDLPEAKPAFAHKFWDRERGVISPGYGLVLPIAYLACEKIGFKLNEILGMRSFLTIPLANRESSIDHPHVDREVAHLVCLYYVTDSDGDTVFFDKTFRDIPPDKVKKEDLKIINRVTPKKGRAVLFDGSIYHASTRPTTGHRVIINFGIW